MRLTVSAVGRLKKGPEAELVADYLKRLRERSRRIGISRVEIFEAREGGGEDRKRAEANLLTASLPKDGKIIALDENGRHVTSRELADILQACLNQGVRNAGFIIGGADGLAENIFTRADDRICFGKMTWPHRLVRVMLMEQLWRSVSILTNHPYHRD